MRLFLLILVLAAVAQLFLPWWVVAPVAFALAAWQGRSGGKSFLAGFGGVGLAWLVLGLWYHLRSDGRLSNRVAELLGLGGSGLAVVLITTLVGGLAGGTAALAGSWLRQALGARPAPTQTDAPLQR
ncbi:hypothetical protein LJY25_05920 [Hymenobacter sp. BT175]|uniref:hypothetical protein n=1 Tax=Hymenobacter translucens TaxID=2886507 RepID=UPI001D0E8736|nr:hypothetical protein [Hymenobacter translucens]MCC2545974.1 hypothetical protein [Hymenobacter translucens]